ncbi:MAG TPA: T9SS type A sorting domain-containing protein [Brumimicrobium sp.]|nr:T9SS type A sorting domain-containing protein [Brumimicrobium sp.]
MKTLLQKNLFKKTSLLVASLGLVFFANAQTQTETQVFTASGSGTSPVVISISIPGDITVNNGVGIQSIKILSLTDAVLADQLPIPGMIACGEVHTYKLTKDGIQIITDGCEVDIDGTDLTNSSTVVLTSVADPVASIFLPFTLSTTLTLEVTYATCTADAGINTTISPCKNEPIFLLDVMDGTPQNGGVWKDPSGDIISIASITTPNLAGQYTYTYTVEESASCTDQASLMIDVQECDFLSVGVHQLENVSIYPNPTKDILNFKGLENGEYQIAILDLSGRVVQPAVVYTSNTTLNLADLQNGIYLVRITRDNSERVIRVVKQ